MTTRLLIVDPQNDFMDPEGALAVTGATGDMQRLAAFIRRAGDGIESILVTLDSHAVHHVAHPHVWVGPDGSHPAPFTAITALDLLEGRWRAARPERQAALRSYVASLEALGRYTLTIWPPHCLIGTPGHAVQPDLYAALMHWAQRTGRALIWHLKGMAEDTEHYSAVRPEVGAAPAVEELRLNSFAHGCRELLIAGEALSHCVAATVRDLNDLAEHRLNRPGAPNYVLLHDCCSSVPGFETAGSDFVSDFAARGMKLRGSTA